MSKKLSVGYIPLIDAALLHVARTYDFAAEEGLDLDLVREASWANIRDKLAAGVFDGAHMLAPAAMAACLGLGNLETALVAPVALGLDGNAITLSNALYAEMMREIAADTQNPAATARALARVIAKRRALGAANLTFAHVFPFSSHHYQLRLWFAAAGINPSTDVDLAVVPPPFMVEALRSGSIDGFCVGAPWSELAVKAAVGHIIHYARDIVHNCPEKLLVLRAEVAAADPDCAAALTHSIRRAADWAAAPGHVEDLAFLLAHDAGLDMPLELLCEILNAARDRASKSPAIRLDPASTQAYPAQADWLYAQMRAAGQVPEGLGVKARSVYRPDLAGDDSADLPPDLRIGVFEPPPDPAV